MQILCAESYGKKFALPFSHVVKQKDVAAKAIVQCKNATRGWQKEAI